ncbi:MAG: alpha-galactosidase [Candidatus Binatia bacterium]
MADDPRRAPTLPLSVELRDGRLRLRAGDAVELTDASLGAVVRRGDERLVWQAEALREEADGAGALWVETGLRAELHWTVQAASTRLTMSLENCGDATLAVEEVTPLVVATLGAGRVGGSAADWSVFRNGYQSWSGTRAYRVDEADADPRWAFLRDVVVDVRQRAAGRAGVLRSELATAIVDRRSGAALGVGFLDGRDCFAGVAVDAHGGQFHRLAATVETAGMVLAPGERLELPALWLAAGGDGEALLAAWAAALGAAMHARVADRSPRGWCSWYYYFTTVTEADVLDNLRALPALRERFPCDYVQVDDGYQRAIGDWLETNDKFPHGMRWLAEKIRAAGFDAGIWLAPFLARPESRLFEEQPAWFVRARSGRPRPGCWNPAWSFGRPAYALDTTHPEVLEWLYQLGRTLVQQWGYRILKLDFLYAAALPGERFDPHATRAQALRRGLQALRDGAGDDAFLLGCGCPLGPAVGLVDGMRIGADVAPFWSNWLSRGPLRDRHGVATKHALRNTLTRAFMHRRLWLNDPDCLMVRATKTQLSAAEVESLTAAIALTDGMLVVSDRLDELPAERLALLDRAVELSGGAARVLDLFERDLPELLQATYDDGELLAVFNFSDAPVDRRVPLAGSDPVRELWSDAELPVADGAVHLQSIPAHGCRLLWRPRRAPVEA